MSNISVENIPLHKLLEAKAEEFEMERNRKPSVYINNREVFVNHLLGKENYYKSNIIHYRGFEVQYNGNMIIVKRKNKDEIKAWKFSKDGEIPQDLLALLEDSKND